MDPFRNSKRSSISFGNSAQKKQPFHTSYLASPYSADPQGNDQPLDGANNLYATRSPLYSPLDFSNGSGTGPFAPPMGKGGSYVTTGNPQGGNFMSGQELMNSNGTGLGPNTRTCSYQEQFPLFGLDWSNDDFVCMSSYKEDSRNKIQVIQSPDLLSWNNVAQADVVYPISKVQWLPSHLHPRQFATASDSLRIWSLNEDTNSLQEQINLSLCKYKKQRNNTAGNKVNLAAAGGCLKNTTTAILGELPPVTSFDWNTVDTNLLVSSSIDTTCIVWDLQSPNYVKTQLIAHDSEVYDVRFLSQSTHLFASCGGDGSVRVFDLRSLAHSTIVYEPPAGEGTVNDVTAQNNALLRLEPSLMDPNIIATLVADSKDILILDMRNPESPALTLKGHSSLVNQIKWHPTKRNVLLSCSDDCQVLYWDLNTALDGSTPTSSSTSITGDTDISMAGTGYEHAIADDTRGKVLDTPNLFYANESQEINNIAWRPQRGDWFGYVSSKKFQNVRVF
ncbi:uncharacterized protein KNAG_0D00740 [Huiozyma naganishii CBS 8797]|uniref:Uncharacterized protein n=1 Tax=Huiozyma naganishii (strain ATCC MYA-139 / BCRC 22969 / CBS 8797 / KCTC 17520 / NBRC 10181 / NCYC 3082 / Yp74L-3) TaxID=1071383 RepID=J7S6K6_HUIN7|nr:hypothetical protein KNAG_0D00740 [Kazachstania naganishii CBS 8797]CCK69826.1 hypothetical protein KNAG_0D00740 [Kazachstania naganishii CBS 8797]